MNCGARLVVVSLVSVLLAGCGPSNDEGFAAGSIELAGLDGQLTSVETLASDDVAVVNFWASYCKPCVRELPELQRVADDLNGDVVVVGVNAMDEPERARAMFQELDVTFPSLLDTNGQAMAAAEVRTLPATFIVQNGEVLWAHTGETTRDELVAALGQHANVDAQP